MIYELEMFTQNPSANKKGFFETKKEAEEVMSKWSKITKEDTINYYGETNFEIKEIYCGEEYFD